MIPIEDLNYNIESKWMWIAPEFVMIKNTVFLVQSLELSIKIADYREDQSRADLRLFPKVIVYDDNKHGAFKAIRTYEHEIRLGKFQVREFEIAELKKIEIKLKRFRKLWGMRSESKS